MLNFEENLDIYTRMNIFSQLDTGNQFLNMLLSTFIMMYVPKVFSFITFYSKFVLQNVGRFFRKFRSNSIQLEGIRSLSSTNWTTRSDNLFSLRFRAFWHYLQKNRNGIYVLKEYPSSDTKERRRYDDDDLDDNNTNTDGDIFIVNQSSPFEIEKDIFCKVTMTEVNNEDSSKTTKGLLNMEKITIEVYSYKKSLGFLEKFINTITDDFMEEVYQSRKNQLFIYTLTGFRKPRHQEDDLTVDWDESKFESKRTFDTIFFDEKERLNQKLDFFINNREWYEKEGHPYTFGIGLHGPPGTGKTSIIKSIANKLKRHLVVISLSKIKTQQQFHKCFYEDEYSIKNKRSPIDFSKKIIVFEDLDCMSNIIMERNKCVLPEESTASDSKYSDKHSDNVLTKNELMEVIKSGIKGKNNDDSNEMLSLLSEKETAKSSDEITLSYILNVIDGILETPGRIMIITSNHYNKLDKALIRPGRIDLTMELNNASVNVIQDIVSHYYDGAKIPNSLIRRMRNGVISPAKLINMRFHCDTLEEYLAELRKIFT